MSRLQELLADDGPRWTGRRPRGVPMVRVMDRDEAARARAMQTGVVISIRAPGMEPADLASGWPAVLSVEIEDVDLHGEFDTAFDLRPAAEAIAQFVWAHRRARHLVVHCHAGVSRSRSVAAAICDTFGWPYHWTVWHKPLYDAVAATLRLRVNQDHAR